MECLGSWYNNNLKKYWFDVFSSRDAFFLLGVFQITAIAPVLVIDHYNINELHLFWGSLLAKDMEVPVV